MGVHQSDEGNKSTSPPAGDLDILPIGRFFDSVNFQTETREGYMLCSQFPAIFGLRDKLGEVQTDSLPISRILGGDVGPEGTEILPTRGEDHQSSSAMWRSTCEDLYVETGIREVSGSLKFRSHLPAFGQTPVASLGFLDEQEYFTRDTRCSGPDGYHISEDSRTMARPEFSSSISSNESERSFEGFDDRCLEGRLGRSITAKKNLRHLVIGRTQQVYELVGTKGYSFFITSFRRRPQGKSSEDPLRQCYSSELFEETGLTEIYDADVSDGGDFGVLPSYAHYNSSWPHSRGFKCPSRSEFQNWSHLHRMDSGQTDIQQSIREEWSSRDRPVCYKAKQSGRKVHFPLPRQSGSGLGCIFSGLESMELDISVPPNPADVRSDLETLVVQGEGDPDSTTLGHENLVSSLTGKVSGMVSSSTRLDTITSLRDRQDIPSEPFRLPTCRLEAVRQGYRNMNHSAEVIEIMIAQHKSNSVRQYQSSWKRFIEFLDSEKIAHGSISMDTVGRFLLREKNQNKEFRTLIGYKCALAIPLKDLLGIDLNSVEFQAFRKGLYNMKPPIRRSPLPFWPLSVVLQYLKSSEFEPVTEASPIKVLQKAFFLVLLACGRRGNEMTNMSSNTRWEESRLWILWREGFSPKMEAEGFQPDCPSILPLESEIENDKLLCPVRALQAWINIKEDESTPWPSQRGFMWPWKLKKMAEMTNLMIEDACRWKEYKLPIKKGLHGVRKLAASYSQAFITSQDDKDLLAKRMGSKTHSVLYRKYVFQVDPLDITFVVPLGTITNKE